MKTLIVAAVAVGFMGAMSLAQAGVSVEHAAKVGSRHEARVAPSNSDKNQPTTSKPTIPGAHKAQSAALSGATQMAIVAGAIVVAGVVFSTTSHANSSATTPGTGGTTGSTGTTGTN